jgi:hypothetical protein
MTLRHGSFALVLAAIILAACTVKPLLFAAPSTTDASKDGAAVPANAPTINPLKVGDAVPAVVVQTADGQPLDLRAAVANKPAILLFYLGHW